MSILSHRGGSDLGHSRLVWSDNEYKIDKSILLNSGEKINLCREMSTAGEPNFVVDFFNGSCFQPALYFSREADYYTNFLGFQENYRLTRNWSILNRAECWHFQVMYLILSPNTENLWKFEKIHGTPSAYLKNPKCFKPISFINADFNATKLD